MKGIDQKKTSHGKRHYKENSPQVREMTEVDTCVFIIHQVHSGKNHFKSSIVL